MKKKRFKEEEIVKILREAQKGDKTIGELCRQHGVSENTFYIWRKKFAGMQVADVRRYRELVKENGRLKQLIAERDLEIHAMKELLEVSKNW